MSAPPTLFPFRALALRRARGIGLAYGSQQIDAKPKWGESGSLGFGSLSMAQAASMASTGVGAGAAGAAAFPLYNAVRGAARRTQAAARCRGTHGALGDALARAAARR